MTGSPFLSHINPFFKLISLFLSSENFGLFKTGAYFSFYYFLGGEILFGGGYEILFTN
jgi:hypothetical protein